MEAGVTLNQVLLAIFPIRDVYVSHFTLEVQFVEEGLSVESLGHVLDEVALPLVPHRHLHLRTIFGPGGVAVLEINDAHGLLQLSVLLPALVCPIEVGVAVIWPSVEAVCRLRLLRNPCPGNSRQ